MVQSIIGAMEYRARPRVRAAPLRNSVDCASKALCLGAGLVFASHSAFPAKRARTGAAHIRIGGHDLVHNCPRTRNEAARDRRSDAVFRRRRARAVHQTRRRSHRHTGAGEPVLRLQQAFVWSFDPLLRRTMQTATDRSPVRTRRSRMGNVPCGFEAISCFDHP